MHRDDADTAPMHTGPAHLRFFKFLAVGGFAAAVNFGSRILFSQHVSYSTAIVLAYLLGMATAFVLNRLLVFKRTSNALLQQIGWFSAINAIALLQTLLISLALADYILPWMGWHWQPELVAHAFGVAAPVVTSYFGHKHFSFK
ncbi:GtrA family protein [Dyella sp. C9]|uniref:GtrA family protein n=1 Tax=Dyella sp. C9 TaxID=2202154 RepID=UPI001E563976|nr:GtrA family protein [Dyella sp. C9]